MKPNSIIVGVSAGLTAFAGFIAAACLSLLELLFFRNFNVASMWHLLVLLFTPVSMLLPVAGYITFLRSPTRRTLGLPVLMSSTSAIAWLLWIAPASRGIVH